MDKVYKHQHTEKNWYSLWEEKGYFTPVINPEKKPFAIIMPPPNANGSLHIGHAAFLTIEDVMIRYHRMVSEVTLWLPGADHALIASSGRHADLELVRGRVGGGAIPAPMSRAKVHHLPTTR